MRRRMAFAKEKLRSESKEKYYPETKTTTDLKNLKPLTLKFDQESENEKVLIQSF